MGQLWEIASRMNSGWATFFAMLIVLGYLARIDRKFTAFMFEHELLIAEYCKTHGLKLHELPTRSRKDLA